VGGVDVIRDVSREREIDEVKSALISTVSHELRTPLTLIHGFAELLVLRDMPVEHRRSSAVEILDASRRPARLIDDLLSVSGMESGRLVLDPRPLDLAAVVERILSPFRAMAARHPADQAPDQPAGGLGRPRQGRADIDQPGRQCDQILPRRRRGPRHRRARRRHRAGERSRPGNSG
jgi:signal transduction histidine kinase